VTVYYKKEELAGIREWLEKNYNNSVKSVSFLLHTDHNFPLPPYEEITEDEYTKTLSKIDFSVKLQSDISNAEITLDECATGSCPIK